MRIRAIRVLIVAAVAAALCAAVSRPTVLVATVTAFGLVQVIYLLAIYLAARAAGIRVDQWVLGFGPELAAVRLGPTRFGLRCAPLGGFVKMRGQGLDDEEPGDALPDDGFAADSYLRKSPLTRAATALSGPLAVLFAGWIVLGSEEARHLASAAFAWSVELLTPRTATSGDVLGRGGEALAATVANGRWGVLFGGLCLYSGLTNLVPAPVLVGGQALVELSDLLCGSVVGRARLVRWIGVATFPLVLVFLAVAFFSVAVLVKAVTTS